MNNSFRIDKPSFDFDTSTQTGQKKILKYSREGLFPEELDLSEWITNPDKVIPKAHQEIKSLKTVNMVINNKAALVFDAVYVDTKTSREYRQNDYYVDLPIASLIQFMIDNDDYVSHLRPRDLKEGDVIEETVYVEDGVHYAEPAHYIMPKFSQEAQDERKHLKHMIYSIEQAQKIEEDNKIMTKRLKIGGAVAAGLLAISVVFYLIGI